MSRKLELVRLHQREERMSTIHYDPDQGQLVLDEGLLRELGSPQDLALEARADGLVVSTAPWPGALVTPVSYGLHGQEETISLTLSAEQAEQLGLHAGPYAAWVDRSRHELYAIPGDLGADETLIRVAIELRVAEVRALEALALRHGARMRDVLLACAAALAAGQAHNVDEPSGSGLGGSDVGHVGGEWFLRYLDPTRARPHMPRSLGDEREGAS